MLTSLFQLLLNIHKDLYNLQPVEEADLDIDCKEFNPEKSKVEMRFRAAKTESANWVPSEDDDFLWQEDKKQFAQVSDRL